MFNSLNLASWFKRLQPEVTAPMHTPTHTPVRFALCFHTLEIGCLTLLADGEWQFAYTEAFLAQALVKPIIGFPEVHKTYRNHQLWPFFSSRIPSADQPYVQFQARRKPLDLTDKAQMLKEFGHRTIANPFALLAVG